MLPEGWTEQSLDSLADYINGRAFKPEDWSKSGLPIIRIAQITNPNAEFDYYDGDDLNPRNLIENGDLIFSWSATLATVFWGKGKGILNQHLFKVIPNQGTDKGYLKQLIDHSIPALADHSHGSTMKHIKRSALKDFVVGVPPLPEQQRIAEILGSVDAAIEATKAVIEQTKTVKQGLLQTLLTRGIGHTEFKDSPLGDIPECWEVRPLGACFKNIDSRRKPVKKDDRAKMRGSIPYYGASGIIDWVNDFLFDEPLLLLAEDGANLLSKSTPIAFVVKGQTWVNNHAHVYQPIGVLDVGLAEEWLCHADIVPFITGSAQPKLNKDKADSIPMPVPPVSEQAIISNVIQSVNLEIEVEEKKLSSLQMLKKGLMDDLLTGRVRVNQPEKVAA